MVGTESIILLVESGTILCTEMRRLLRESGYRVLSCEHTQSAADQAIQLKPDMVIIDTSLANGNGLALCRHLRPQIDRPLLIVSSQRSEEVEMDALESGADDFLDLPVQPRLLLARVNALLSRCIRIGGTPQRIRLTSMTIDAAQQGVKMGENMIPLTSGEFDLLWMLAEQAGRVVPREQVFKQLRGFEYNGFDRAIDIRIARLRRKLGDNGKHPALIHSIRGVGYMLSP
ncbi:MAG: response regulator transcription factor [bacterium]|nr:response regulator transcription factor [bacterium]